MWMWLLLVRVLFFLPCSFLLFTLFFSLLHGHSSLRKGVVVMLKKMLIWYALLCKYYVISSPYSSSSSHIHPLFKRLLLLVVVAVVVVLSVSVWLSAVGCVVIRVFFCMVVVVLFGVYILSCALKWFWVLTLALFTLPVHQSQNLKKKKTPYTTTVPFFSLGLLAFFFFTLSLLPFSISNF